MIHEPTVKITHSRGWTLDSGVKIPPHDLHRFICSCGWEGGASYAERSRAERHWNDHIESLRSSEPNETA